ncbi:UNVERIFIED_CONTAM: hypothetical protein FKN15_076728 [Acipenser sinensis]
MAPVFSPLAEAPGRETSPLRCWTCREVGHLARDCPVRECGLSRPGKQVQLPQSLQQTGFVIPVSVDGTKTQALLDSGCGQSLIQDSLISLGHKRLLGQVHIKCIHGDVRSYPKISVNITIGQQVTQVHVGLCPRLPVPVVLGWDCGQFKDWLAALTAPSTLLAKKEEVIGEIFPFCDPNLFCHRFRPRKTRRERRAAKNEGWQWTDSERFQVGAVGEESGGEAAEPAQGSGSAASASDRPDTELEAMGADFLARSRDFRLEQGRDDVLGRLFDQVAVVNGRVVEPRRAATYPHFEINRDLLYRVDKLPQTGEVRHQLLIPQPFKED